MKKIFWVYISLLGLIIVPAVFAQETMTLTTFYPSPIGAYDSIRLVPRTTLVAADCDEAAELGLFYYDSTNNVFQICIDDGGIGWQILTASGTGGLWTKTGNNLYPTDFANANLRVGIGTDLPDEKLFIRGGNLGLSVLGTEPGIIWEPKPSASYTKNVAKIGTVPTAADGGTWARKDLVFYTGNEYNYTVDASESMRIMSNGRVGIATTSPASMLELGSGDLAISDNSHRSGKIRLWREATTSDSLVSHAIGTELYHNVYGGGSSYTNSIGHKFYRGGGELIAQLGFGGGGTLAKRLNSYFAGKVGLGTNTPGARLDIISNSTAEGGWQEAIRLSHPSHSAITLPAGGLLFGLHSNGRFYFRDTNGSKYVMTIVAVTGNVGIGTTSPAVKLDVIGDINASGNVQFDNELRTNKRFNTYYDIDGGVDSVENLGSHDICFLSAVEIPNDATGKCMVHFDNPNINWTTQSNITKAPGVKPTWYLYAKRSGSSSNDIRCKATCMEFGP